MATAFLINGGDTCIYCLECDGTGVIPTPRVPHHAYVCPTCKFTGWVWSDKKTLKVGEAFAGKKPREEISHVFAECENGVGAGNNQKYVFP